MLVTLYQMFDLLTEGWRALLTVQSLSGLCEWYQHTDPFVTGSALVVVVSLLCWIVSVITGNCSQVDRIWSIGPFIYLWLLAARPLWIPGENWSDRLIIMASILTLWGLRLSYNFWRKGGYTKGHEDYRWPVLRKKIPTIPFQIFNFTFIAFIQNILLYLIVSPGYVAWVHRATPLNDYDYAALGLWVLLWLGEVVADQQQWNFQTKKYELINKGQKLAGEYADGFISSGLFQFSRHPNFFCEISLWWAFYFFEFGATGNVTVNWSIIGPLALNFLFHGSTNFTESLTAEKYPKYKLYQQSVSRLFPWLPNNSWKEKKE